MCNKGKDWLWAPAYPLFLPVRISVFYGNHFHPEAKLNTIQFVTFDTLTSNFPHTYYSLAALGCTYITFPEHSTDLYTNVDFTSSRCHPGLLIKPARNAGRGQDDHDIALRVHLQILSNQQRLHKHEVHKLQIVKYVF